jgi:hypothetical protein
MLIVAHDDLSAEHLGTRTLVQDYREVLMATISSNHS